MAIKKLKNNERILVFVTGIVAAMALAYSLLIEPVTSQWGILDKQIKAKRVAARQNITLLSNYSAIEEEYKKFSSNAQASAFKEEDVTAGFEELEILAKSNSIAIMTIKPQSAKDSSSLREIVLEITAEADARALSKFLYELERPKNLFRVKRFTVVPASSKGSMGLRCTFVISKILVI